MEEKEREQKTEIEIVQNLPRITANNRLNVKIVKLQYLKNLS